MPGLYTVTTRAPGTLITGLIYNGDHEVHIVGRSAEFMQAHAISASQMDLQESPFGPDGVTENLPPSIAGELMRLRFVIGTIKDLLNGDTTDTRWWVPIPAPAFTAIGARVVRATSQSIPTGAGTVINFTGATEEFNSGVWVGGSPTRFTAPLTGLYYAACGVLWDTSTGGGRRQIQIGVNGTASNQAVKTNTTAAGVQQRQTVCGLMKLTAADYVEFFAFQDSGASVNLIGFTSASITGGLIYFGETP